MNFRPELASRATLHQAGIDEDRMLTFSEWCQINSFSESTGQRLVANGQGPVFVRLSARRKGSPSAKIVGGRKPARLKRPPE